MDKARTPQEHDTRDSLEQIIDRFGQWVKQLADQVNQTRDEADLQSIEEQIRDQGQAILGQLFQSIAQDAIDRHQESARTCPDCGSRRRHQGVRRRLLRSSLGSIEVHGVYWRCPACGCCGHTGQTLMPDSFSGLLCQLTALLGASLASFHKAEVVADRLLNVKLDDETIRRHCLTEGWQAARHADSPPVPVAEGATLIGSCDGTMVRTRQTGWREVKGYRFEHEGGRFGGASLDSSEQFLPRLRSAAERVGHANAGTKVFLSDMAGWITRGIPKQLPDWEMIADFYHASKHVHEAGQHLYGEHDPRARRWGHYWSRRLKHHGAGYVSDRLRHIALFYRDTGAQRHVLDLAKFLDRHAERMDYPGYRARDLPIGSGPMESFCKQIGQRMKGPGMFWSTANVTPMAHLVSRWSLEPERFLAKPPRSRQTSSLAA